MVLDLALGEERRWGVGHPGGTEPPPEMSAMLLGWGQGEDNPFLNV